MRIEELLNGWERVRNKTLNRLVLAGNKLVDDDMDHLTMLLRGPYASRNLVWIRTVLQATGCTSSRNVTFPVDYGYSNSP